MVGECEDSRAWSYAPLSKYQTKVQERPIFRAKSPIHCPMDSCFLAKYQLGRKVHLEVEPSKLILLRRLINENSTVGLIKQLPYLVECDCLLLR
jgi:hypothetical protein